MSTRTFTFTVQAQQGATWLDGKPLNQWFEIPGTNLSSRPPSVSTFGQPGSKITAWCGATLRRTGSVYLIGAAGGHGDYGGNEVNALALNTPTPQWVELRGPSALADMVDYSGVYLDGRRSSAHTYNATQFINQDDRLVILPSYGMGESTLPDASAQWQSLYPASRIMASFSASSWTSANAGNDWDAAQFLASISTPRNGYYTTAPDMGMLGIGAAACSDPLTGDIYQTRMSYQLWKWTYATKTWSRISAAFPDGTYAAMSCDQVVRNGEQFKRLLFTTTQAYPNNPGVYRSDTGAKITTSVASGSLPWSVLISDENALEKYPGIVYDEFNDRWIVFKSYVEFAAANLKMYSVKYVDATTYNITEIPQIAVSGSTLPDISGARTGVKRNGIHNAVQYVPELRGVVVADQYSQNVHFMRVG